MIIAEYDADGALTNVSAEEVLFAESETKRFDVPPEGNIFIWNTLSGMFPMTK